MPPKPRSNPPQQPHPPDACKHLTLAVKSSHLAASNGYTQYTEQQLSSAMISKCNNTVSDLCKEIDFPAPLGLPGDVLLVEPKYPPQSVMAWERLSGRNKITARRKVIYVASPPVMTRIERTEFLDGGSELPRAEPSQTPSPDIGDIIEYLKVFYHGVEVRPLPELLSWVPWEEGPRERPHETKKLPGAMGLKTSQAIIRIRMRYATQSSTPRKGRPPRNIFPYQVNQLDLLDVAIDVLPADAYALILIVNQDMYEDEDDDFCCGRAFGGSRVCVVSTARYDPGLDNIQGVDREHAWPASHCADFVARACGEKPPTNKRKTRNSGEEDAHNGALSEAVKTYLETFGTFDTSTNYLMRVCRTASHEMGHCFGMDHCMYYACAMQGTSSLVEDNRQPPYACPVCEAKIGHAVTGGKSSDICGWKSERLQAIQDYCYQKGGAFKPLGVWTREVCNNGRIEVQGQE